MKSLFHRLSVISAALVCIAAAEPAGHEPETTPGKPVDPPAREASVNPSGNAFLGVITSRLPRIMTEQLGLKPDEGLIVVAIAPEGPASKTTLAVNDIITGVGDQAIREPRDLTETIRKHTPGDVVRLKLIRKGEPTELDVTLGSKPTGAVGSREIDQLLRKLVEERLTADSHPKDFEQLAKGGEAMEIPVGASIRIVDENGCVELKNNGDRKEVVVRDKNNKITWSGPWNNEEEKKSAPAEVTKRFRELDIESIFESNNIRLTLPGTRKAGKPESGGKPAEKSADR